MKTTCNGDVMLCVAMTTKSEIVKHLLKIVVISKEMVPMKQIIFNSVFVFTFVALFDAFNILKNSKNSVSVIKHR